MEGKEVISPLVLVIENDENDIFLLRRALSKCEWVGDLRVVGSVSEARAYLENAFPFKDDVYYRRPDLIISDYRLNSHTAADFVSWLQTEPKFQEIPVVILTGAASHIPPEKLAGMRVRGFIVKNPDVSKLGQALQEYLPAPSRLPESTSKAHQSQSALSRGTSA